MRIAFTGSREWEGKYHGGVLEFEIPSLIQRALAKQEVSAVHVGDAMGVDAAVVDLLRSTVTEIYIYGVNRKFRNCKGLPRTENMHLVDYQSTNWRIAYLERDRQIVQNCDILYAIWNGTSTGTKYTFEYAQSIGKIVHLAKFENHQFKFYTLV